LDLVARTVGVELRVVPLDADDRAVISILDGEQRVVGEVKRRGVYDAADPDTLTEALRAKLGGRVSCRGVEEADKRLRPERMAGERED
jgi:hypothetical protein